jgi:hypothetical protein
LAIAGINEFGISSMLSTQNKCQAVNFSVADAITDLDTQGLISSGKLKDSFKLSPEGKKRFAACAAARQQKAA